MRSPIPLATLVMILFGVLLVWSVTRERNGRR
jgi:hypothetical protein